MNTHSREQWVPIDEFPGYAVSSYGRVMNIATDLIKVPTPNQQGIANVNLVQNGKQNRRGVALLVAKAFLPTPIRETFDTPINLDGDRLNNCVDNLEWRPRWFAIKYHMQLKRPIAYGFDGVLELIETGEIFDCIRDCSTKYGLLESEIILSSHNRVPVFPTWQTFQLVLK